jgi:tripartite ATP-independent transporter DctM subunit
MFIIMGYFALYAGLTKGMFHAARQWVGHLPGGLAIATVLGCTGFAAASGSSTATAAVMGRVAIPEMKAYGYHPRLAAGVVAAAGTLASLIPPSVILVIYAIIVEQSVGALLLAGFLPGLVSALIYVAMIYVRVRLRPTLGSQAPRASWGERFVSLRGVGGILFLVALVLGGLYGGVFTPTEAGGVGAFGALLLAVLSRGLTWERLWEALLETGRTTVMIFFLIVGVLIFVRFLAFSGLPKQFMATAMQTAAPPVVVLIVILLVYVVLGMFMDAIGLLMLTLPLVFPVVTALGYDPIWFGIIVVKMAEMCLITPPIGLNCYVVAGVDPEVPLSEIFRGILPFFVMDVLTVATLIAFPQIVLLLPRTMLGR